VSIARAVYSDADVYLIDDCLSALDAHVGKKILDKVLLGHLKDKTRIMVTHHLHFLDRMDSVILMHHGRVAIEGPFAEIENSVEYQEFSSGGGKLEKEESQENLDQEPEPQDQKDVNKKLSKIKEDIIIDKKGDAEVGKLTKKETRFTGQVGMSVYIFYFKNGGICLTILIMLLLALMVFSKIVADWWVGQWAKNSFSSFTSGDYIRVYAYLVGLYALVAVLKALVWSYFVSLSSTNIFAKLIWNVLRKPMSFFDTTPSGVILNRGTNDMEEADKNFPLRFDGFLELLFQIVSSIMLAVIVSPYVLVIIIFDGVIFYFNMKKYVKTSTELRRLAQMSKSPILTTLNEMMQGSAVLRTYQVKDWIFGKWMTFHNRAWTVEYHEKMSENWIKIRTEFCLVSIVFVAGLLIVYGKTSSINPVTDGASLALVITYLITLTSKLGFFVFQMSEVAKGGSIIQRLREYCDDELFEAELEAPKARTNWPESGKIEVKDISVRYRDGLPDVLNKLSFTIDSC
jgi:ABC-type multidrug transport system fused ATPase/permease subunit